MPHRRRRGSTGDRICREGGEPRAAEATVAAAVSICRRVTVHPDHRRNLPADHSRCRLWAHGDLPLPERLSRPGSRAACCSQIVARRRAPAAIRSVAATSARHLLMSPGRAWFTPGYQLVQTTNCSSWWQFGRWIDHWTRSGLGRSPVVRIDSHLSHRLTTRCHHSVTSSGSGDRPTLSQKCNQLALDRHARIYIRFRIIRRIEPRYGGVAPGMAGETVPP